MISNNRIKEICDLYYKDVYRYCFSFVKKVTDSQDLTQETFKFLIEKAPELQDKNIKAWLYSVALIKIKQYSNNKSSLPTNISFDVRDDRMLFDEDEFYTIEDAISQYLYDDERIDTEKQKVLDLLTEKERKLYEEAYVKKKKHSEIAHDKGVSEISINVQTYRLRKKIRAIVKGIVDYCLMIFIN